MSEFKYVMFRNDDGTETPIIFPGNLVHAEVADKLMLAGGMPKNSIPIRAGFIDLMVIQTHGSSETLKMESSPDDARTINCYPYSHGNETGMEPMVEQMMLIKGMELMIGKVKKG